jgi:hypothetical protein
MEVVGLRRSFLGGSADPPAEGQERERPNGNVSTLFDLGFNHHLLASHDSSLTRRTVRGRHQSIIRKP